MLLTQLTLGWAPPSAHQPQTPRASTASVPSTAQIMAAQMAATWPVSAMQPLAAMRAWGRLWRTGLPLWDHAAPSSERRCTACRAPAAPPPQVHTALPPCRSPPLHAPFGRDAPHPAASSLFSWYRCPLESQRRALTEALNQGLFASTTNFKLLDQHKTREKYHRQHVCNTNMAGECRRLSV